MTQEGMPHKLTMSQRSNLSMTGVTEIISFDEAEVVLQTGLGLLTVQGQNLQLKTLTLEGGQVDVNGTIDSLAYEEPRQPGSWLRRLLG